MLPTQGYFKDITCPYYDSGLCERPHCQFRHSKQGEEEAVSKITTEREKNMFDIHGVSEVNADMSQSILERLVSETVKKVLSHPEILPGAIASGSVKSISQSLVSKVVGELKPRTPFVVHTSAVVESPPDSPEGHTVYIPSTSVPSYKPTPISELKKRQGPVPYKPHASSKSRLKRKNRDYILPHSKYTKAELCTDTDGWKKLPYIPKAVGSSHPKYSPTHNDYSSCSKVVSYIPSSISSLSSDSNDYVPLPVTSTLNVPDYQPSNINCANKEDDYVPEGLETEHSYIPTIRSELENMNRINNASVLNTILSETMTEDHKIFVEDCERDREEDCERTKETNSKGDKEKDCGSLSTSSGQMLPTEKKKKVKSAFSNQESDITKASEGKQKSSSSSTSHKSKSHSSSQKHTHIASKHKRTDNKVKKTEHYKTKKAHKEDKSERKRERVQSLSHKNSASGKFTDLNTKKVKHKEAQFSSEKQKVKHGMCNSKSASKTSPLKSPKKQEDEDKCKTALHGKDNFSAKPLKVKEMSSSSSMNKKGYGKYEAALREIMGSSIDEDSFDLGLSESDEETVREECFRIFQEYNPQPLPTTPVKAVVQKSSRKPEKQKLDKSSAGIPASKAESSSKRTLKQTTPNVTKLREPKNLNSKSGNPGTPSLMSRICSTANTTATATQQQTATQQAITTGRIRIAQVQNVERLLNAKHKMKAELESRQRSKPSYSSATLKESSGFAKQQQHCKISQSAKTDTKKMFQHLQQHKRRFLGNRDVQ